jgi:hypothetical protein
VRIAVIADIHGNLPALESVLADIERRAQVRSTLAKKIGLGRGGKAAKNVRRMAARRK